MRRLCTVALVLASGGLLFAQQPQPPAELKPGSNLVLEHIPAIPMAIADATRPYNQSRAALLADWSPTDRSLLITTRFAETAQVHRVSMPGGDRKQLTFFPDRVQGATYVPDGSAFLLTKDIGGNEWSQIYRDDLQTGQITLLTDGTSRNGEPLFAHKGNTFAYTVTRRGSGDAEIWIGDAASAAKAHKLLSFTGAGWQALAWSHSDSQLLVQQYLSANNSNLYLVNVATGDKRLLTPHKDTEQISWSGGAFTADDKGIYTATDGGSEFSRLVHFDLATSQAKTLTANIPWDVDDIQSTEDGRLVAFSTNENGISRLHLLDTASDSYKPLDIPEGELLAMRFHRNGRDLGITLNRAVAPPDVYSVDVTTGKLERWTTSETGGLPASAFPQSSLITWKSFDGMPISGYLTAPDPKRFPGKRPVIISIHGGPEGQTRPGFLGANSYWVNELGIVGIEPNVRGSTGYGKTFLAADNGVKRDATYKDIGALLDWIATQPNLDKDRVMIIGGSYGGHMTWAISAFYNDRIRCAVPIVGPSNLVTFLQNTEAYRRDLRRVEYGDERDPAVRAWMEKWAPMNHVDAMHKPVFAVVGKNDPRVPWTESRQIVDKLEAQGTPTWFLVANDEGHGYAKRANRDFQFAAVVLFVKTYLLDGMPDPSSAAGTR